MVGLAGVVGLVGVPGVARAEPAAGGAVRWALSEPVLHGDGVARGVAVTVEDVVVGDTEGAITIRACCGLEDLATCPDSSTYEIGWAFDREVGVLERGDSVGVTLTNSRTSGSCAEIDPFAVVAGDDGNPADSLPGLGVTFPGPVGIFDDSGAGGRYYPTNAEPHTDHDGSLRTVSVLDAETMLDEGYFHLDVAHRWGLQYEVVWLYAATDEATTGAGDGGGGSSRCSQAQAPAGWALALLALAARRARR